jgi:predicted XRE-type DNA-binding protein
MPKKQTKEHEEIEVIVSSGNVYADTGHPNPEEAMAKAELAILISDAIKRKKLTQKMAAELIGVDQPKISAIIRGQLSGFTIDRLFRFLISLGMDIIIEAKPHTRKTPLAHIQVLHQQPCKTTRATA